MHIDWGVVAYFAFGVISIGGILLWFCHNKNSLS
jgi:hypothetical protein